MAAHGNTFIRLRLFFDYPPPAAVGCRMCWLLVDLNTCRVVADLESIIRERFGFSRSSILSLFIEDCYLPHTESIYVVRDNDNIRVQVGCLAQVNGHCPEAANVNCKKRQRDTGEDGPSVEHKKKEKKKKSEGGTADQSNLAKVENRNKVPQTKKATKKKKKKTVESLDNSHAAVPHKSSRPKKTPAGKIKKLKASSTDSSSSSSSNKDKTCHQKVAKKPCTTPAASNGPPNRKPTPKKSQPPSSSSSSSSEMDSSLDEAESLKVPPKTKALSLKPSNSNSPQAAPAKQSAHCAQKQASSLEEPPHNEVMEPHVQGSEEEIQLVIRRPQQPFLNIPSQVPRRGLSRGKDRRWAGGDPGERTQGGGQSDVQCFRNGTKDSSYQTDFLINKSVVFQNEDQAVPKKDYSSMPLLAGPPQVGQKIAFKLLELTENYTPEVSDYKEGKIVNFDPMTKQIELELLNTSQAPSEPGKFDLVYQNPDGSETVEYAVQRGSLVMERWESLLEPRLII